MHSRTASPAGCGKRAPFDRFPWLLVMTSGITTSIEMQMLIIRFFCVAKHRKVSFSLRFEENFGNIYPIFFHVFFSSAFCVPGISSPWRPWRHYVTIFGDVPPGAGLQTHLTDGIEHLRHPLCPLQAGLQVIDSIPAPTLKWCVLKCHDQHRYLKISP